ncbi:uncharacterized protein ASPGLDRAFT_49059, partial [Aspergillus glaucus CBS 516.65]
MYCRVLLAGWCGLQAWKHTLGHLGAFGDTGSYSSSGEAAVAIFLMFWIWCVFTLKSAAP